MTKVGAIIDWLRIAAVVPDVEAFEEQIMQ